MVKGVGHLGHDEAMEAEGREFSLHGRVVKGVGHLGHDEAMEAEGREFSLHGYSAFTYKNYKMRFCKFASKPRTLPLYSE